MRDPLRYCIENLSNSLSVADAAVKAGCLQFVLSSTAALFGFPKRIPIDEEAEVAPVSAYGESKLMVERGLAWADQVHGLRSAACATSTPPAPTRAGRSARTMSPRRIWCRWRSAPRSARRPPLTVFGTDYPTPDGTCIRDYVHVPDLADAHLRVLARLETGSCRYNVGNGTGYSVKQVIEAVERIGGRPVPHSFGPRRAGDPAVLVASSARLREETGWTPRYGAMDDIVRTAWDWHEAHPKGYADRG